MHSRARLNNIKVSIEAIVKSMESSPTPTDLFEYGLRKGFINGLMSALGFVESELRRVHDEEVKP